MLPSALSDCSPRTKEFCSNLNEFLYKSAHEPSLAGHRIQEHVYKTVPTLIKEQTNANNNITKINGHLFDLDYTANFLHQLEDSIYHSSQTRETISELASKISSIVSRTNRPR